VTVTLERKLARRRMAQRVNRVLPLELSAKTPALAVTPAPIGKPNGPGLWHVKGMEFPPYFQNVRNALIRNGHSTADASRITWGAIRRWARGGGHVHSEVREAARSALASISGKEARAHAQHDSKEHSLSIEDQLTLIEFANPYHGASGSGHGGQFVAASNTGGGAAPAAKSAGSTSATAKAQANQPKPISPQQKKKYLNQAAADHAKAQALRQQAAQINRMIAALAALISVEQKALAISSAGKTTSGTGTTTGSGSGTSTTSSAKGTTTSAASAKASATASKTASATAKATSSSKTMLAQNKAQMKQLTAKRDQLVSQANQLDQQASNYTKLANG
jgi:hypothetical protein